MADIELVIKIAEKAYNALTHTEFDASLVVDEMRKSIANGTPLPKGHGRLIDADILDRNLENAQVNLGDALSEAFDDGLIWASEVTSKVPTIIEADRKEQE